MVCLKRVVLAVHFTAALEHVVSCTEGLPVTLPSLRNADTSTHLEHKLRFTSFSGVDTGLHTAGELGRTTQPLPSEGYCY